MPSLVIPNGIQVRLKWNLPGATTAINVLTAQSGAGVQPTQAIANTVGAAIKSQFTSSGYGALTPAGFSLNKVGLRWIGAPNFPEFEDTGAAVVGTGVGDLLPKQTAFCVTIRTAFAGKSFRGRVYLCGFIETANDPSGLASVATQTAAVNFVNGIASSLSASGYTLGVGSRERLADPTAVPPVTAKPAGFTPYSAIVSRDLLWDTQRRRRT